MTHRPVARESPQLGIIYVQQIIHHCNAWKRGPTGQWTALCRALTDSSPNHRLIVYGPLPDDMTIELIVVYVSLGETHGWCGWCACYKQMVMHLSNQYLLVSFPSFVLNLLQWYKVQTRSTSMISQFNPSIYEDSFYNIWVDRI